MPSLIPPVSSPTEGTYAGHPVITFPDPDNPAKPGVQMGIKKLRAVLANMKAAEAFVAKHHKPKPKVEATKTEPLVDMLKKLGVSDVEIAKALGGGS